MPKRISTRINKINILHLVQSFNVGGAEIMLIQYIKALNKEKYNHIVYCFGQEGPVKEKLEALDVIVHMGRKRGFLKNPAKFIYSILLLLIDLRKFIKVNGIHVIQSHLSHANQLGIVMSKILRVPAFPTVHNTMEFIDRRNVYDPRIYFNKILNEILFRFADAIIAVSDEVKSIIIEKFNTREKKIVVVKNGIVLNAPLRHCESRDKELYRKNKKIKVIAVGRLTYQKAMEVLVKASAQLLKTGIDNVTVNIVGDGEQRGMLERAIAKNKLEKFVTLTGIRHDVIDLMQNSDIFVMPSRYEGLSIAMIEAMACGLPIIASDAPGISSYVEHGVNGLLFPIEDHNALSKQILRLAKDHTLRKALSDKSKISFNKDFNMKNNIFPLERIIKKFVNI